MKRLLSRMRHKARECDGEPIVEDVTLPVDASARDTTRDEMRLYGKPVYVQSAEIGVPSVAGDAERSAAIREFLEGHLE